jgi:tetratricopeptide (TPR) repeat protein
MKTIDYSYFIESYNSGKMSQAEKAWFLMELEGNESLQKEVLLRKKTDQILKQQDIITLRAKLSSIEKFRKEEVVKNSKLKSPRFHYAAIFTGLVVIGSLFFLTFNNQSPETIYKKYNQVYNIPGASRSTETIYNEAIEYFNKKEYSKALAGFQTYLKNNPGSVKYEFLSGVSYMEIKNYPDSKNSFNRVLGNKSNLYTEDASWYLAMCYLATEDKVLAKFEFSKIAGSESIHKNKAKRILRHL